MKLSQLEQLCAAMRQKANMVGNVDPTVEFYEQSRVAMMNAIHSGSHFLNMEPDCSAPLSECMVVKDGDVANRGDFAIPLRLC